ncbi:MAG: hypothetical protein EOP54_08145 [Sphingobacteriales bacterium]|nr:MAG: hypothetical protein EOP54_08145 [Sphingobacteriales bacterium]
MGGYKVTFKVIAAAQYEKLNGKREDIIRNSIPVQPNNSTNFELEFSKHEDVTNKIEYQVEGYKIYIYSLIMIVFEKLRAICQQLEQYQEIIPKFHPRPRARDFYDIHLLLNEPELIDIDLNSNDNQELLMRIFEAKKVPIEFMLSVEDSREFHRTSWSAVKDTVSATEPLEPFDFYFDFVLERFDLK